MKSNCILVARVWFKDKPSKFYHFRSSIKGLLAFVESMLPCKDVHDIQIFKTVEWLNDEPSELDLSGVNLLSGVQND